SDVCSSDLAVGGLQKVDAHAFGDNAGGAVAQAGNRLQQRAFFFRAGVARVFAQPCRDAVNLQQFSQVADGVVLEQVRPRQNAVQPAAGNVAGFGAVRSEEHTSELQ